jgi:hypothetical protein
MIGVLGTTLRLSVLQLALDRTLGVLERTQAFDRRCALHAAVGTCVLERDRAVLKRTPLESGFSSLLSIFTRKIVIFSRCPTKH